MIFEFVVFRWVLCFDYIRNSEAATRAVVKAV